jgi:Rad3-related DNA helicase
MVRNLHKSPSNPHCFQAALYAAMISKSQDISCVARLVFAATGSNQKRTVQLEFESSEVFSVLAQLLDILLFEEHLLALFARSRQKISKGLLFPYPMNRESQRAVVAAISGSFEQNLPVFLESPTGSGKTVSALYPALIDGARRNRALFFGTAKNSQKIAASKTLRDINSQNSRAKVTAVALESRERLCLNDSDSKICDSRHCRFASDYHLKLRRSRLLASLLRRGVSLECDGLLRIAKHLEICPFELSQDIAKYSHAVVCDYNHILSPTSKLERFFGSPEQSHRIQLIFDEAHNLPDRVCREYSPELVTRIARGGKSSAERLAPGQRRFFASFNRLFSETIDGIMLTRGDELGGKQCVIDVDDQVRERFKNLQVSCLAAFSRYSTRIGQLSFNDAVLLLFREINSFCDMILALEFGLRAPYSLLIHDRGEDRAAKILCKDSSQILARFFPEFLTPIFMSATLSPMDFFVQKLGFGEPSRCSIILAPSFFPQANRRLFIVPQVTSQFRYREAQVPKIAECISKILGFQKRNTFVFFPSFSLCQSVFQKVLIPPEFNAHLQMPAQTPDEVRAKISAFVTSDGLQVLFGVLRGGFAEGIDLPGAALESVVIVGPALPSVSKEQTLIEEFEAGCGRDGFDQAAVIPAMVHVNQAMGRLIRSPSDKGTCFLLDRRFADDRYYSRISLDWRSQDVRSQISKTITADVISFWQGVSPVSCELSSEARLSIK